MKAEDATLIAEGSEFRYVWDEVKRRLSLIPEIIETGCTTPGWMWVKTDDGRQGFTVQLNAREVDQMKDDLETIINVKVEEVRVRLAQE